MAKASVGEIFSFAIKQTFRADVIKTIVLPIAVIYFGLSFIFIWLLGIPVIDPISAGVTTGTVFGLLIYLIISILVMVIVAVRTHRHYLLDETMPRDIVSTIQSGYYWAYVRKALLLIVVMFGPLFIALIVMIFSNAIGFVGLIAAWVFLFYAIRWSLILPAAAVGGVMSFAESNKYFMGHKLFYFWATVLIILGFSLANAIWGAFTGTAPLTEASSLFGFLLGSAMESLLTVFQATAAAFALSYVFKIATGMETERTPFEPMTESTPEISDDSSDETSDE